MKKTLSLKLSVLFSLLAFSLNCPASDTSADNNELKFSTDGKFKIVQFTDTHIESCDDKDHQTAALMGEILDKEKPDLVIFTGDNIACTKDYKSTADLCFQPVIDRKIKWAAVLGNHDHEDGHDRKAVMQYLCDKPYSLAQMGPEDIYGYSNYYLQITANEGDKVQWVLYLLDSNSYPTNRKNGKYDWIHIDQVQWYNNNSKQLSEEAAKSDRELKALAFFHIPLPEYAVAFDNGEVLSGHKFEKECSPTLNSGLFTAMVERGDVKATFVGHDHVNDYEAEYMGIRLCFGRSTGYHAYGIEKLNKGAKVITIDQKTGNFETRIVEATAKN